MLLIRESQMAVFTRQSRIQFEERLLSHFLELYPREVRQAGGEGQIRQLVQSGIQRAGAAGFDTEKQITLFVSLLFMLGCDFDSDPQLPWAREISVRSIRNPSLRIDSVYNKAIEYLEATAGEDCEYVVRALLRIRKYDLSGAPQSTGGQFVQDVLRILEEFCPEKFRYQGEEANRQLVALSFGTARKFRIAENRGLLLLASLMFMMGSGADHDLLYPWVSQALTSPAAGTESERTDRLYRSSLDHIESSLQPD